VTSELRLPLVSERDQMEKSFGDRPLPAGTDNNDNNNDDNSNNKG